MNLILNIIVLIFEVLYYALFMKFARKEERLYKYILAFILGTIVVALLDGIKVIAYVSFIFTVLLSLLNTNPNRFLYSSICLYISSVISNEDLKYIIH